MENQWLTDESVNFCISYICSHSKWKDRILPFSSLFFAKLTSDPTRVARHDLVARWTRKNKDIFDKDVLLFVVHKNHHWSLIIVIKPYMVRESPYLKIRINLKPCFSCFQVKITQVQVKVL